MIERGGKDEERLYLYDADIEVFGKPMSFRKTDLPDMRSLIHRHEMRYYLPASLTKAGDKVLDFPCGSGYAFNIFKNVVYEGKDIDAPTIDYARRFYCPSKKVFNTGDLSNPHLEKKHYNLIACIEGIEHIPVEKHKNLIQEFHNALVEGGTLVVSSPESSKSGPSKENKYHLWEYTKSDFITLLGQYFTDIQIVTKEDVLHTGEKTNINFAICRRGKDGSNSGTGNKSQR